MAAESEAVRYGEHGHDETDEIYCGQHLVTFLMDVSPLERKLN